VSNDADKVKADDRATMAKLAGGIFFMLRGLFGLGIAVLSAQLTVVPVSAAPASDYVRVKERYGAAVREDSVADGTVLLNSACNDTYLLIGSNGPWRQVFSVVGLPDEDTLDEDDDIFGWIHLEHVIVGSDPAPVDCGAALPYGIGKQVQSSTNRGCMTLRSEASFGAGESECRPDGTLYEVVDGPTGGGEEWFEVRPLSGGPNGFAPGRELFPVP
jgi:hypothetical protein